MLSAREDSENKAISIIFQSSSVPGPLERRSALCERIKPEDTPLVYQTTASLGLAQVQLRSPKVVVATGAAARGSKKWYNFLQK